VNCWLVLTGIEDAAGDIAIELRFAAAPLTVKAAFAVMLPDWAVMVTVPGANPVARPEGATLAMLESVELHCTVLLTSLVVPSDMWAVAVNC
jgi:hypothetical protein